MLQVKFWITHNEPFVISYKGYEAGSKPPNRKDQGYIATHHLILAHGSAYRLYESKYKPTQKGDMCVYASSLSFVVATIFIYLHFNAVVVNLQINIQLDGSFYVGNFCKEYAWKIKF